MEQEQRRKSPDKSLPAELIREAKKHDKKAFVLLMERIEPALYKVAKAMLCYDEDVADAMLCYDEDVADAMQETVLSAWEHIGDLKTNRYFKTWVIRILINHCNVILRKRSHTVAEEAAPEPVIYENGFSGIEWDLLLSCLDEKYRIVVYLFYGEGWKTKEIAKVLELPDSTVRGRLRTAREKLQRELYGERAVVQTLDEKVRVMV